MTIETRKTGIRWSCGLLAALLVAWAGAAAAQTPEARQLTVEQVGILAVEAPAPAQVNPLTVTAWVDHQDNTYALGEQVQVFVQTNKDAYVTVLNVDPNGVTTVLFPNRFQLNNRVQANTVTRVPDAASGAAITVSGPVGAELIKVIASTQPRPPFAVVAPLGQTAPFRRLATSADETARALQVVLEDQAGGEWDDYNKTILTVPRREAAAVVAPGAAWPAPAFGLRLAADKSQYRLNEAVTLMVEADRTCHLALINTGPSGMSRQIFPNRYQQNAVIQAGQTVVVPGLGSGVTLRPMGPVGMENVTAVCRDGDRPAAGVVTDFRRDVFPPIPGGAGGRNLAVVFGAPSPTPAAPNVPPAPATALSTASFLVVN